MLIVNGAGAGAGVEAGATAEAVSAAPKATIAAPGLQPATFAQPVVPLRPRRNEPTPADPRTRPKPSADDLLPLETGPQTLPAMPELRDAGEPPARLSIPAGEPPRRVEPVELPRATFAPVPTAGEARQAMKVGAYDTELTPGAQAKQIALALHAARPMPAAAGQPLSLRDCLAQRGQTDRQTVIDAYWLLAQRVAEYHLAGQRLQWCGELLSVVERAGSAAALAQVQAAQQSAAAAIEDARLAMLDAQFDLARRMTLAEAVAPPLPSTAPHWGRYLTDAERLPQPAAAAWSLRRLAGLIGARAVVIQRQAAAVVAAEDARQSTAAGLSRQGGVAAALEAVAAQAAAAQQMLRTLTEHNSAIAEYALSVLPPQVGDDELLAALVVKN
jgi:hypothetical protein